MAVLTNSWAHPSPLQPDRCVLVMQPHRYGQDCITICPHFDAAKRHCRTPEAIRALGSDQRCGRITHPPTVLLQSDAPSPTSAPSPLSSTFFHPPTSSYTPHTPSPRGNGTLRGVPIHFTSSNGIPLDVVALQKKIPMLVDTNFLRRKATCVVRE